MLVLFLPRWLTGAEQGFYYAFNSLIGLQIFFDLGLNYVVVQTVSHEFAHLGVNCHGRLEGEPNNLYRVAYLARFLRKWYRIVSLGFFFVIGGGGIYFFCGNNMVSQDYWLTTWCLLVFGVSCNIYFSPMFAILEGCGQIGYMAKVRLKQSIISSVILWLLLEMRMGLLSMPIAQFLGLLYLLWWLNRKAKIIIGLKELALPLSADRISYRQEIFPMQWKIALSWMSGYFIFQLVTPLLFMHQGPIIAGQVGFTQHIFNTLSTFGMSWVNTKTPRFGALIAGNNRRELNRLYWAGLNRSLAFTIIGSIGLYLGACWIKSCGFTLGERIASLMVIALMALIAVFNIFIFAAAAYMRAHREEPMLGVSIIGGVLTGIAVYIGSLNSAEWTMILYGSVTIFVGFPWTAILFLKYYRAGHV